MKSTIQVPSGAPSLWRMFRRFGPQLRRQRKIITVSIIAMLGEVMLRLLEPWPIKWAVDNVILADEAASPATTQRWLIFAVVAVVAIAALRSGAGYARRVGFAIAGSKVLARVRSDLFSHLQRLSLGFHSRSRTGDLITRVTGDIGRVKEVTITAVMPMFAHTLALVGMLVVMFFMDWRLGLIAVSIIPLFALSTMRIGKRIRKVAREQRARKGEMGATAAEAIGSIRTVQALGIEDVHGAAFSDRNKADMREGVKAKRLSARLIMTADVLIALATGLVLYFGAGMAARGEVTVGELIVFLSYLKSALRPVRNLAKYSGRIAKAAASAERILEILDSVPDVRDSDDAVDAPEEIGTLKFEGVTFGYNERHTALDEMTFTASAGDIVTLAGPSGAGKSTVVNLLLRLYDPREGVITFDGHDLRTLRVDSVRQRIAVVPQENVLFAVSVRDNIAFGAPGATDEEVVAAAKLARAHKFIKALPDGYDTLVGERGDSFSEGQRQRIAIARAAIRRAPILILDEPTSSLDNENNKHIRAALDGLARDRICFIVAHDLSLVPDDSLVLFLEQGRLIEHGRHADLVRGTGRYASMYALQRINRGDIEHAVSG